MELAPLLDLLNNEPWPRRLNDRLRKELTNEFHVEPEVTARLRYVQRDGEFAGRPVRFVRIFDPTLVAGDPEAIKHYDEAHDDCVLFEGFLEKKDGMPILKDVRKAFAVR